MMSSAEHWWNHLSSQQRDFIIAFYTASEPDMLLIELVPNAFQRQQNIGWSRESDWPQSEMRII